MDLIKTKWKNEAESSNKEDIAKKFDGRNAVDFCEHTRVKTVLSVVSMKEAEL